MLPASVLRLIRRFVSVPRSAEIAFRESFAIAVATIATRDRNAAVARQRRSITRDDVRIIDITDQHDCFEDSDADSLSSVSSDASASAIRDYASRRVWGTPSLQPKQHRAIHCILHKKKLRVSSLSWSGLGAARV